jgi:UDP-glucuronate decarboxylase
MKKILAAGGAGFLGSHMCDRLLEAGHHVICLDNLQTGFKENVAHLETHAHFELIEHDVIEPIDVDADIIMNLASAASPIMYQMDPMHTFKTNILGTLNLLELAKRKKAVFFLASTSEVYGDPLVHPQPESYWGSVNPIGIRSCYDEGKRGAETLTFDFHREYGVNIKVARFFNTYGPRMNPRDGRVVSNFINQALYHQPITINGDGTQTRSFCYLDDLLDGIMAFLFSAPEITGPINLGNPDEFTMLELAEKVIAMTNSQSEIRFQEMPQDDPKQRKPDISRAKTCLNWQPSIDLDAGLAKTIQYFSELKDNAISTKKWE